MFSAGCSAAADQPENDAAAAKIAAAAKQAKAAGYQSQYDILSDGVVTDAEYRQAWLDVLSCSARGGLQVEPLQVMAGPFGWEYISAWEPGPGQSSEVASKIGDDCQNRYQLLVDSGRDAQRGGVLDPDFRRPLVQCLTARGYDIPDTVTTYVDIQSAVGDPAGFSACIQSALDGVDGETPPRPTPAPSTS